LASAEPPFSWTYQYEEEPRAQGSAFLEKPLLRPVVPAALEGPTGESPRIVALVDSGCDHVLAPLWLAETVGVEPDESQQIGIRIGGETRTVRFAEVRLRLFEPGAGTTDSDAASAIDWTCQVGFFMRWSDPPWLLILGQLGFFDRFTVTMSRFSQRLAIEDQEQFDERFASSPVTPSPSGDPRFRP
jgi:hypothetical protein